MGGSPRVSARPAVAEAAAGAGLKRLIPLVSTELTRRGLNRPDPEVVRTIAAVSARYRMGPASDPPFPTAGDIDKPVVPFVALCLTGRETQPPDRHIHRTTVAATVDFNLDQLGVRNVSAQARTTLTSIALGAWRPGLDENAKRNAISGFVVRWYRDGLA